MKKFSWIFALLCTIALLFSFAGCGGDDGPGTTPDDTIPGGDVAVTGVAITHNGEEVTELVVLPDAEFTLAAKITPANATVKTVEWSSSDTTVAEVSAIGVVTIKGVDGNTATITATSTADTTKKATLALTVSEEAEEIITDPEPEHIGVAPAILWDGTEWATVLGEVTIGCLNEEGDANTIDNFDWPTFELTAANYEDAGWDVAFFNLSDVSSYTTLKVQISRPTGSIVNNATAGWVGTFYGEDGGWNDYDGSIAAVRSANGDGVTNARITITVTLSGGSPDTGTLAEALQNFSGVCVGGFVNSGWSNGWGAAVYTVEKIWFE